MQQISESSTEKSWKLPPLPERDNWNHLTSEQNLIDLIPGNVVVQVFPDAETLGEAVAKDILLSLSSTPSPVLGLATGSSPKSTYRALGDLLKSESYHSLRVAVRTFNLDDYLSLSPQDANSYFAEAQKITDILGIPFENSLVPNFYSDWIHSRHLLDRCIQYEQQIDAAGGIDFQVLGIGPKEDPHLGFNPINSYFDLPTRIVTLTEAAREANKRFFDNDISRVPKQAATMGLGTILEKTATAGLIAIGSHKADSITRALLGEPSLANHASGLRFHKRAYVYLDPEAAAGLGLDVTFRRIF